MRLHALLLTACLLSSCAAAAGQATVTLIGGNEPHQFQVELADTPDTRARGLMHRTELAEEAGMLFIFDHPAEVGFWMRNTLIPLDMLFIDERGSIVHIHHRAQPHDERMISSRQPITHVLEINGGLAESLGIEVGHQMQLQLGGQSSDAE
ncbi:MAG: DUF192 domain-containing protein [Gammaproteobacteria bacterium]|nr:MAG: DUF192 domain-containing protein [Gammaproteobacteria bacterium]